ncbi:MAG: InlB B-repeat-containing protein [Bacilli bacterium]|nr:InlB B-repeat-containing protein [Bacilli bacterium]
MKHNYSSKFIYKELTKLKLFLAMFLVASISLVAYSMANPASAGTCTSISSNTLYTTGYALIRVTGPDGNYNEYKVQGTWASPSWSGSSTTNTTYWSNFVTNNSKTVNVAISLNSSGGSGSIAAGTITALSSTGYSTNKTRGDGETNSSYIYLKNIPVELVIPAGQKLTARAHSSDCDTNPHMYCYTATGTGGDNTLTNYAQGGQTKKCYLSVNNASLHIRSTGSSPIYNVGNGSQHWNMTYAQTALTVNYNANGGSGTTPSSDTFNYSDTYSSGLAENNGLTKTGYHGNNKWHVGSATGTLLSSTTSYTGKTLATATSTNIDSADASVTLYADYDPNDYTVTFNPNGGTFQGTTSTSTKTVTYDSGTNSAPGVPTRTGYTFQGWYYSKYQVFDASGVAVNGTFWNTTATSGWNLIYDVEDSVVEGYKIGWYHEGSTNTNHLVAYKPGQSQAYQWQGSGWSSLLVSSDFLTEVESTTTTTSPNGSNPCTYYDQQTFTTMVNGRYYALVFYSTEGGQSGQNQRDLTFLYESGDTAWKYTSNLTVTARWIPNQYTVTFNPNGGTFQNTTSTSTKGVAYNININNNPGVATMDNNHTFNGWWTATSGGTQVFNSSGTAITGTYWSSSGTVPTVHTGSGSGGDVTIHNGTYYYGYYYDTASGEHDYFGIDYWNGSSWTNIWDERDSAYSSLHRPVSYNGELYIVYVYNNSLSSCYRWNGNGWTSVSTIPFTYSYVTSNTFTETTAAYGNLPVWIGASNLTVYAQWNYTPSTFTLTRSDYNTFTYSASGAAAYYVSTSSTTPDASASGWTTSTSKDVSTSAKETWYVWAKDSDGNVSTTSKSITNYKVTLSAGTGTTLTAKADSTTGANVTSGSYVLDGTSVYPTGALSAGYNTLVVKRGSTTITNTSNQVINTSNGGDTTFSTTATVNKVTLTINKNGAACTDCSGYTVHISNSSTTDSNSWSGTTTTASTLAISGAMSTSSTYYVWVGKDSNHKSTMAYSGVSFTGAAAATGTINFYVVTMSLSNTTMTFNGTSVTNGGTVVALGTGTGSKIHAIVGTPSSGYTFSSWSSSTTSSAIASTSSASTTMNVGAATTLTGTSTQNSATITIKKDGSAWSASGIKISLRTSSTATTDSYTQTVSSGSTATFSGLATTYYIFAGKSDAAKTTMVYTGYTIGAGLSQTKDVNYYTITRSQGSGTTLTTKWDSSSGTAFTNNPVVLGNNVVTIYASSTINTGYEGTATLKHGTTTMTASGSTFTVSVNEAITSGGATPKVLTITLDNQSATTAGTTTIYEKYATGYYLESSCTNQMTTSANGITIPTKTGYTFGGYYTSASGGTKYIDSSGKLTSSASYTNFTSEGTLYAHWSKAVSSLSNTITTSYIYDGNSHCPTPIVKDGSTTLTNNTDYTYACNNNTNVGTATLTITGKNVYNSTTKAYYTGTTTINFNINNATLTFNANAGTGGGTVYTRYGSEVVYSGIRNSDETSIPSVSKTGYTLNGWYTAESGGSKVLNANGSFASPIVSGYTIDSETGEIIWATTADRTLYAQYSVNIYTITLNNQSATTAGTASIYEKYGVGYYKEAACTNQMTTSSNGITVPTKTGYAFMGYYTETNGGGTKYIDASGKLTSSASNTHFTSNGTLYAYWSRTKLRITESVKGNQADTSKEFSFTINVKDNNEDAISGTYAYTGSKSGNLSFSGGNATFTLHHGQYIDIYFPTGSTYTITQDSDGYSLEKTNDSGTLNSDTTATFTDTLSEVAPTGLFFDILPYIILLVSSMGSIFLVSKFRNI